MTAQILPFPRRPAAQMYSMGCPRCGSSHGVLNLKAQHWGFCEAHQCKWLIGTDLFQHWRGENDRIWFANAITLQSYETVQPVKRWRP